MIASFLPRRLRCKGRESERGFLAAEWIFAISVLAFPAFAIVLSLVQFPARENLTQVASAAAARAYVQALDQSQADAAARAAAADAIASELNNNPGTSDADVTKYLADHGVTVQSTDSNGYCPGEEISVKVTMPYPVSINPFGKSASLFHVGNLSSASTERIDDYGDLANSASQPIPGYTYDVDNDPCGP